ncbi:tumor necrosis factor ligand superfamily member 13B-like isoform X2 [Anguilla rostrata]|uniref:tumor necrosis factor ligand superfamily member 13B-like isoform X2 n=1 Tax=Anguilla rostrata TaxID=7938 RepID=UPI0030D38A88
MPWWISVKNVLSRSAAITQYNVSMFVTVVALSLSLILIHEVSVLRNDLEKLKGEILFHLSQSASVDLHSGQGIPETWEKLRSSSSALRHTKTERGRQDPLKTSFLRMKREQGGHVDNVTVIPWTVSIQNGEAVSSKDNKIIVQQDGYYMVFSQVLFHNPEVVMGHLIRRRKSNVSGTEQRFTDLLRCLQEMPKNNCANSCYTAGIVKLEREDELELVILDRPQAQVAMEADSTFFGMIHLP